VTSPGYLRYPHLHGDLIAFVAEDDLWLAGSASTGGRAWRLTEDTAMATYPRFSPDGTQIAWTSYRDGAPEVYLTDTEGTAATRLTYWGDDLTRVLGWTAGGDVLAISTTGQPDTDRTWAYAIPPDGRPPRRLPYGPVSGLAITDDLTALVASRLSREPASWKRYRGGTAGRLWTATTADPLFTRILADLTAQLASPMVIGGRVVFLSDHEGTGNIYSCRADGTDLRRHTDHDGFYARNPSTDGTRVIYHVAGDIWLLDSLDAEQPRKLEITLGTPARARAPRLVSAADHLGGLDCDHTGQASAVEVRGTIHWLTHQDGPARAVFVDENSRARHPVVIGTTGKVAFAVDDRLLIASADGDQGDVRTIGLGGWAASLAASPDGATVAAATHDGKVYLASVESGTVTELAAGRNGPATGLAWSPDSEWLAWSEGEVEPLRRIRIAHVPGDRSADGEVADLTDGRFEDTSPVFTADGLYLAFLSKRSFDPVYDTQSFDMTFPYGGRPYLVTLAAATPSPFGPLAGGRPAAAPKENDDSAERPALTVDLDGIGSRVVPVPVPEARYSELAAVKGGLVWLHDAVHGVLGESDAKLDNPPPRPSLERFDLAKREVTELAGELNWFAVSGDGARLVIRNGDELRVVPSESKTEAPSADSVVVDLTRARFTADPAALWRHAYGEAGRLMRRDFWDPGMSGVDWDGVLDAYRPLLDRVRGAGDFADLMWEVFGELGTSHAYVRQADSGSSGNDAAVGLLGADLSAVSGQWVVDRVLPGESSDPRARSPLMAPGAAIRPGDAVVAVDGRPVDPVRGPAPLLAGTAGKPVELTVSSPGSGQARRAVVMPLRSDRRLRYQDWVASRRTLVRELSDGKLGYLHIPDMMGEGWAHFSRDARSEMKREGLIMDIRSNNGGHISQLVIEKLTPKVIGWDAVRWFESEGYPYNARRGPVVALADEMAGSDGDIVTATIKVLGLAPVVGTRTWGGVIGINGFYELIDGTRITRPQAAFWFSDGLGWSVENHGVDPDVEVLITPDDWAAGRDPQLETAVRMALEAVEKEPATPVPDTSTGPVKARPPLPPRG
jgi:tricorn protease